MVIIGERLNSSRRSVYDALARKNKSYLVEQARLQAMAGADYHDVNAAALMEREKKILRWTVPLVQAATGVPLSIDTPDPLAMDIALRVHRGRALLNSLSGEKKKLERILPLIKDYHPRVIALCLDDSGPAATPDRALAIARRMVGFLLPLGLEPGDIFIDPLVYPAAADQEGGVRFLASLRRIKEKLSSVQTIAGLSNISSGLPQRKLLNRTFLVMAVEAGLDAVICDPLDRELRSALAAAEAILGREPAWKTLHRAGFR
jgi:cobalamin-dependent methionine synthase I